MTKSTIRPAYSEDPHPASPCEGEVFILFDCIPRVARRMEVAYPGLISLAPLGNAVN